MTETRTVNQIDLHLHTTASQDGQYAPGELLELCAEHHLRAVAFADHDSTASVAEGVRLSPGFGMEFVPGVELTTDRQGYELHLLAYFVRPEERELIELLAEIARARAEQSRLRCERLRQLGFALDDARVLALSGNKPPTAYPIFRAIMEDPANRAFGPAERYRTGDRARSPVYNFARDYFAKDQPAAVEVRSIDTTDAVRLVRRWRALPVLAHPGRTPIELLDDLIAAGLAGLEVYNSSHTSEQTDACLRLARERRLLVTAGSDFHGPAIKPDVLLADLPYAGYDLYEKLRSAHAGP